MDYALSPRIVELAAPVLEFGAKKYAALNYVKGMAASRVMKSFRRHAMAIVNSGLDLYAPDEESGLPHLGHMAANVLFAHTYMRYAPKGFIDDRLNLKSVLK